MISSSRCHSNLLLLVGLFSVSRLGCWVDSPARAEGEGEGEDEGGEGDGGEGDGDAMFSWFVVPSIGCV